MSREDCINTTVACDRRIDSPQELSLKFQLIKVLRTTVELEDGFVDFDPLALEGFEAHASPDELRSVIENSRQLADINQKATKKAVESEQYAAISRHLLALAGLYAEPSSNGKRRGPNNPYAMPTDYGVSLSRVGDSMRHRTGRAH